MANEIKIQMSITAEKNGAKVERQVSDSIDMAGHSMTHGVQGIPTGGEVFVESDILGTAGWAYVKNLDADNYVTLGSHASSNHLVKLLPGESALFRCAGSLYGAANTAECKVEYIIIEL
jgi:hypothetical protein